MFALFNIQFFIQRPWRFLLKKIKQCIAVVEPLVVDKSFFYKGLFVFALNSIKYNGDKITKWGLESGYNTVEWWKADQKW